ncbi:MAG: hypothetical protein NTU60_13075 [Candidatus Aminicenantes bacterium]|nr:hypothetical protein [Candidatus Aminicenantes bacterium]
MKKSLILMLALLTTGILVLAAAVNVTGTWEMTTVSQRGERKNDITFKQDGEKLAVSMMMPGRQGAEPTEVKGEGTVKGNDIEWKITRTTQRGEFTTTYKGTIADDKNMAGKSEMGMGEQTMTQEWKAVKK